MLKIADAWTTHVQHANPRSLAPLAESVGLCLCCNNAAMQGWDQAKERKGIARRALYSRPNPPHTNSPSCCRSVLDRLNLPSTTTAQSILCSPHSDVPKTTPTPSTRRAACVKAPSTYFTSYDLLSAIQPKPPKKPPPAACCLGHVISQDAAKWSGRSQV